MAQVEERAPGRVAHRRGTASSWCAGVATTDPGLAHRKRSVLRRDMSEAFVPEAAGLVSSLLALQTDLIGRAVIHRLVVVDLVEEKVGGLVRGVRRRRVRPRQSRAFSGPRTPVGCGHAPLNKKASPGRTSAWPVAELPVRHPRRRGLRGRSHPHLGVLTGEQFARSRYAVSTAQPGDLRWIGQPRGSQRWRLKTLSSTVRRPSLQAKCGARA